MPIYEYRCRCGHQFEKLCRVDDDKQSFPCPRCEGEARRIISVFRKGGSSGNVAGGGTGSGCSGCSGSNCSSCH